MSELNLNLEEAIKLLERYSDFEPHHVFKLKPHIDPSRRWHEGTIYEVRDNVIIFHWAPSPFDESDDAWMQEHEIPIEDIDISTLKWWGRSE